MRKVIYSLAMMMGFALMASPCFAGFTLFDTAKDSMFIARGEFTSLQRTNKGDRLIFRCDETLKGSISGEVTLEPFEIAPADEALGREAIVGFDLINGKYYFSATNQRRGVFMAEDGIDHCETALRALIAINAPHQPLIESELRKRIQLANLAYEGEYPAELTSAWKEELVKQCALHNSAAARDAAKCLFEHNLFKGQATLSDLQRIAREVPATPINSTERSYQLLVIRNELSVHPGMPVLLAMLNEETGTACVGRLADFFYSKDRATVLAAMAGIVDNGSSTAQQKTNALQVLQALRDKNGLNIVRGALASEQARGADFNKQVTRRALLAMKDTPDATSIEALETFFNSDICSTKPEFKKRALLAMAMIDSQHTNDFLSNAYKNEKSAGLKQFIKSLLPQNKAWRSVVIVHDED